RSLEAHSLLFDYELQVVQRRSVEIEGIIDNLIEPVGYRFCCFLEDTAHFLAGLGSGKQRNCRTAQRADHKTDQPGANARGNGLIGRLKAVAHGTLSEACN